MKMNTIYKLSIFAGAFLAAFAAVSCTKGDERLPESEGFAITFRTGTSSAVQVKGTPTAGDDAFNENLLNSVYYFLYPMDKTDVAPTVSGFKSGISETESYTAQIPVSANAVVNELFASGNKCQLFAVANPPADLVSSLEGKPTLAQLRSMVVLSSLNDIPQANFTLVYDDTITASSLSQTVAVNAVVEMKHLAAKFTFGAIVAPSIEMPTGEVYTPYGLNVRLCNGVNRTTMSGWDKTVIEEGDWFDSELIELAVDPEDPTITIEDIDYTKFKASKPAYSYPMEWEFNSETEPYLMYELNWKITSATSTSYKALYYKLTLGRRSIMSNEWYDISGKLTVLGSLYPEEPKEIYYYMDYLVSGWKDALTVEGNSGINTPAEIKDTRYLAVPQTEWTLNNKNEVIIPFSSSHECIVENAKLIKVSYSSGTESTSTTNLNPASTTPVKFDLSKHNEITVTHALNNDLGANMDVTPCTITFDLRHNDDSNFIEHITIEQRPAIYLATYANSGGRSSSNGYGYTYVNNTQSGNWQIVLGANSSGNNSSIYLTVITVSQFDPSTGFIVGDPRDPNVNNLDINTNTAGIQWNAVNPVNAPAKYHGDGTTGNRQILYYHPTIDDGSMDNVVAPSIRVNSANCRSGQNETYQNAKQRCAAYQEDGYPAGRWRLPTLAECKLIQTMSSNGLVPTIFIQNGTSYYCYAGGWFAGNASKDADYKPYSAGYSKTTATGGSGGGAARCVYDEWYWSQVDAKMGWDNSNKTFTWGDVPDDFVIPTTE